MLPALRVRIEVADYWHALCLVHAASCKGARCAQLLVSRTSRLSCSGALRPVCLRQADAKVECEHSRFFTSSCTFTPASIWPSARLLTRPISSICCTCLPCDVPCDMWPHICVGAGRLRFARAGFERRQGAGGAAERQVVGARGALWCAVSPCICSFGHLPRVTYRAPPCNTPALQACLVSLAAQHRVASIRRRHVAHTFQCQVT